MITVTAAIILNNNRVLIAKRNKEEKLGGKWEFPGGKLEEKENPEECLCRELKEELNILIEVTDFFAENVHEYDYGTIKLKSYFAKWVAGSVRPNVHERTKWVKLSELLKYDFAPADIPIVNRLVELEE